MPKTTFFNLPSGKKHTLIEALQKEFSHVPLTDASISNIIQYANIPRGSFYQYFHNKEDAFYYLFDQHISITIETFLWILKKHDGNLFEAMVDFFQVIISDEENYRFFKNVLLNMNHRMEDSFTNIFTDEKKKGHFDQITKIVDFKQLKSAAQNEFSQLMKLLSTITVHAMTQKYAKDLPLELALKNYRAQLELVKNGVIERR
ncbi:TetR/AcrR family transcriptional regulator [Gracilibacillus oryzae]|uniref:TetR/AcrR family transcriptional regulator n=1 Tax=Gracilibacillus oryzae TaxID=1672701 RepID=UPI001885D49E|nr:TetR/AcrR family transcriptional regulator [Gracilibacillus oryzae]